MFSKSETITDENETIISSTENSVFKEPTAKYPILLVILLLGWMEMRLKT
ncbi:hypothetical protein [Vagococcus fluvialis]|nr:hypothetical protein [Vagococcus fluvialis]UDM79001.1 hypothetical protein K5K97_09795 [Vagococcus fluvialis]